MIFNKGGVQSHMLIIVVVSILMTLLILSVLGTVFVSDPVACQNYDFEIESDTCKDGSALDLSLKNMAKNKIVDLNLGNSKNITLDIGESRRVKVGLRGEGSKFVITPFFEDISGETYLCRGKRDSINLNRLVKC